MIPVYLNLLVVVAIGVLLTHWQLQRRTLQQIITGRFGPVSDPVTTIRGFAGWIHAHVPRGQDPPFISSLFHVVGATPIAVLRDGGCCSGLARLYILGLDALGIRAAQVTLYHVSGCAQHCAVEVALGGAAWGFGSSFRCGPALPCPSPGAPLSRCSTSPRKREGRGGVKQPTPASAVPQGCPETPSAPARAR